MAKVTGLKLSLLTGGGDREFIATWSFSKKHVSNYSVQFQYYAETSQVKRSSKGTYYKVWAWVDGSSSTVTHRQATYTAPEGATKVRVRVKPNSTKTKKVGKTKTYWWTGAYSNYVSANVYDYYPDPPSTPSITVDGNSVTVTCENLDDVADAVCFHIVKNDSSSETKTVSVKLNKATYTFDGDDGCRYRVRARARNIVTRSVAVGKKTVKKNFEYWSDYSDYSSNVDTQPIPPTNLKVKVKSETSVLLEWTKSITANTYEIHYATSEDELKRESGASYKTQSTGDNVSSYILAGLDTGQTWYFRLKSVGANNAASDYTEIVNITLGSDPAAPTTWSSASTAYVGEKVNLYWVHNSEDGSGQVKANVEVSIDGEVVLNEEVANKKDEYGEWSDETSVYELDTSVYKDSDELLWRVRTMGVTNKYGDWSIQRSIKVYSKPSLLIDVLDGENGATTEVVDKFPLHLKLSTSPASQTPIGYSISIISTETYKALDETGMTTVVNSGDEVYTNYIDGNGKSDDLMLTLLPSDIDIQNGVTYNVTGTVSFDSGLKAECPGSEANPVTFITALEDEIYEINASIIYNEDDLSTHISPYCTPTEASGLEFLVDHYGNYLCDREGNFLVGIFKPDDNTEDNTEEVESDEIDYAPDVTLSVYRREANGRFVEIKTGIANDGSVVNDPHPTLDAARYRIVAISDLTGAVSYEDVSEVVGESCIVIQWNEEWIDYNGEDEDDDTPKWSGSRVKLPYNIDVTESNSLDVSLVEYIGRSRPVSYYGTQLGENPSWSCEIPKEDVDTLYQLRQLSIYPGDVYVREPSGLGYWAQVSVSWNSKHKSLTIPVTLNIKPVEGGM